MRKQASFLKYRINLGEKKQSFLIVLVQFEIVAFTAFDEAVEDD